MQKGQIEYAIRKAHEDFDRWNDCTGLIPKFCGYYYEALGEIEAGEEIARAVRHLVEPGAAGEIAHGTGGQVDLELVAENLVTLCADPCHIVHGHLMSWTRINPRVREDAAIYLGRIREARAGGS